MATYISLLDLISSSVQLSSCSYSLPKLRSSSLRVLPRDEIYAEPLFYDLAMIRAKTDHGVSLWVYDIIDKA